MSYVRECDSDRPTARSKIFVLRASSHLARRSSADELLGVVSNARVTCASSAALLKGPVGSTLHSADTAASGDLYDIFDTLREARTVVVEDKVKTDARANCAPRDATRFAPAICLRLPSTYRLPLERI